MREVYRNPVLYYLLIPVLVALWPLLVWGVYLPRAERAWENEQALYVEGQTCMVDILRIDPERLIFVNDSRTSSEFSYGSAVDRVANLCKIPPRSWSFSTGNIMPVQRKRRQDATVKLTDVSIVQAARFLSTIQSTWVNLHCDRLELSKRKGVPDQWEADLHFTYYY
jgi:hypothetical protein